jgi:hypothetical protein
MDLKSRGRKGRTLFEDSAFRRRLNVGRVRQSQKSTPVQSVDKLDTNIEALYSSHELLFERLDTEPRVRRLVRSIGNKSKIASSKVSMVTRNATPLQRTITSVAVIVMILITAGLGTRTGSPRPGTSIQDDSNLTEVAGVQSESSDKTTQVPEDSGTSTSNPSFDILTPTIGFKGGIERTTPVGDKIYTYSDKIGGIKVEVTQQPLPESLNKDRDSKLAEFAKNNNMTSVIQIDEEKVYHGKNEKSGVQSVMAYKDGLLIFIRCDTVVSDDNLTGYILGLK